MFLRIAIFELAYFRRQPSFYITTLLLLAFTFLTMISDNVHIGASSNTHFNSPHTIAQTHLVLSMIGMFLVANFVGGAAVRDSSHKMDGIVLATGISKAAYLWGRLSGAWFFCLLVFLAVPLGMLLGSLWPSVDSERLGPTLLMPYLWSYLVFVIPNFLFCAVLFYAMALKARSMMGMYLGVVLFFILYNIALALTQDPHWRDLAALIDPFGLAAYIDLTLYWTSHERNTQLFSVEGTLLYNRIIWLTVSAVMVVWMQWRFRLRTELKVGRSRRATPMQAAPKLQPLRSIEPVAGGDFLRMRSRLGFELKQIVGSAPFIILCLFSLFSLISLFFESDGHFGTSNWPVTRNMAEYVFGAFLLMTMIVITYYSGESVWRERQLGIGDIVDATPVRNWGLYFPKLLAIVFVTIALTLTGLLFAVMYQISKGYTNFEWDVYCGLSLLQFVLPMTMLGVLAIFIQVLSPGKYIGMLIFLGFSLLSALVFAKIGLEHNMWQFASTPGLSYSDLNRYGHFSTGKLWYNIYWGALCAIVVVLAYAVWPRGKEYALRHRLHTMRNQIGAAGAAVMVLAIFLFFGSAAYIHYNTRVLNTFVTPDQNFDWQADYEKKYARFKRDKLPTITDINVNVEFYPDERKVISKGFYLIENQNREALSKVLVIWDAGQHHVMKLRSAAAKETERDERLGASWLVFEPALAPGAKSRLDFEFVRANIGFVDSGQDNRVVANGSFVNNSEIMPHFGYMQAMQLIDRHERRKRDLPAPERMAKLEDRSRYGGSLLGEEADFINFEATVSTSADQHAIAPGYLQKEWLQNGRRYFHYKMDAPMLNFVAFLSGRWQVSRDEHHGINIEVYHHAAHDKNVARMIEATKASLDYFGREFSPYQHRQVRILEFPRYERFAQSFANTIPYSEDIGFLADLRDPDSTDYVYFVTAHEMAHQWWGHQVAEANVQGAAVLAETLAEYSAYMVMEEKIGKDHLRKFLKYELDRYLRGRIGEVLEEMPLYRAENQQYIHYQKGGIVMYALRDRFGAAVINTALRNFLQEYQYKSDPYPTTLDLLRHLKAAAPATEHEFIADLFERITLFDLKVKTARTTKLASGKYQLQLVVEANKFYVDGKGEETRAALNEPLDIAVFSADPDKAKGSDHVLHLAKYRIKSGENMLTFELDTLPVYAGIDPYIKMIDRKSDDNLKRVDLQ